MFASISVSSRWRVRCCFLALTVLLVATAIATAEEPTLEAHARTVAKELFEDPKVAALATAAAMGDVKEIDRLVAAGVDVNARSKDCTLTPLFFAIIRNQYLSKEQTITAGFRRLLEHGADPNFHLICADIRLPNDRRMTFPGGQPRWSIVHLAAGDEWNTEWLEALLKHGANPNLVYPGNSDINGDDLCAGWSPLFEAINAADNARFTHPPAPIGVKNIDLLINAGANINHQASDGDSPVVCAASENMFGIVWRLLQRGADYRIKNNRGYDLAAEIVYGRIRRRTDVRTDAAENPDLAKVVAFLESKGVDFAAVRKAVEKDIRQLRERRDKSLPKIYPGLGHVDRDPATEKGKNSPKDEKGEDESN